MQPISNRHLINNKVLCGGLYDLAEHISISLSIDLSFLHDFKVFGFSLKKFAKFFRILLLFLKLVINIFKGKKLSFKLYVSNLSFLSNVFSYALYLLILNFLNFF